MRMTLWAREPNLIEPVFMIATQYTHRHKLWSMGIAGRGASGHRQRKHSGRAVACAQPFEPAPQVRPLLMFKGQAKPALCCQRNRNIAHGKRPTCHMLMGCLLYTSDAADE